MEFLNASPGNRAGLAQLVQRWDEPGATPQTPRNNATEADLTGDGQPEIVLGLVDPSSPANPAGPRGLVVALHSEGGRYRSIPMPALGGAGQVAGPFVQQVADVNADRAAEVLLTSQACGASTCTTSVGVASWAGGAYRLLTPQDLSIASATVKLEDRDRDGRLELILEGGQVGSAGAGPQRGRTEIYRFVGGRYELAETVVEPSTTRYLTIVDANTALNRKDFRTAEQLYQRAATDDTLSDERPSGGPNPGPGLRAFARFRLMTLYATQGKDDEAREVLQRMQTADAATPYPAAAQTFWNTYSQTGSVEAGCKQFAESASRHPGLLEPLTGWGYANSDLKAADLCVEP